MSILKQRVPLTTGGKMITTEWLKDLQALERSLTTTTTTTTGTGTDTGPTVAQVAALEVENASLKSQLAALVVRVQKLEQGYQA